jgi:hypothetical protein
MGTIYKIELKVAGQEQVKAAEVDLSKLDKAARQLAEGIAGGAGAKGLGRLFSANPDLLKLAQVATTAPPTASASQAAAAAKGIDWKQVALGLGAAPFSPWVGARGLSGSGLFGSGGGGGGGLLGRLMGTGGLGGFMEAYIAIQTAMHGLRIAFEQLTSAVQRGAQLYLKAAELGTSAFTTSRLQKTAQLLGMPESALTNLVASGQFMRGQRVTGQDMSNILLGSGRGVLGKEDLQAVLNLSKEVAGAWNRVNADARAAAISAYALFKTNMNFGELKSAWSRLWQDLATAISPVMNLMANALTGYLRAFAGQVEQWIQVMQFLRLIPKGGDEAFKRQIGGAPVTRPESAWEKMGLIISGGIGGSDYARQTAQNTKRIADALESKNTPVNYNMTSMVPFSLP